MEDTSTGPGGLLTTGKRIARSIGDLVQTRLELFLVELKEERFRVLDALVLMGLGAVCGLMVLVLILAMLYGLGAGAAFWTLRQRLRNWNAFAATLEEMKKDRECLDKQS
jgi:uncharacterized membrane protein YqjE